MSVRISRISRRAWGQYADDTGEPFISEMNKLIREKKWKKLSELKATLKPRTNPCGSEFRKANPSDARGVQRQLERYRKLGIHTTFKEYPIANGKVGFWEIRMEHSKHGFVRVQMPLKYATGNHDAALSRTLSALSRKLLGRRPVRSNPVKKDRPTNSTLKLAVAIQELEAQVGRLYSLDPRAERKLQRKIDALKVKLRGRRK